VLIDRDNWPLHRWWFLLVIALTVGAGIWFFTDAAANGRWPPGSSVPGFTFGVIGGAICFFELLLWPRKKVRTWRIGRTQVWLRAHIWLGLLSLPLLVFHSGFHFTGTLANVLMILFVIVILSGVWGLVLQQFIPKTLLDEVPAETIYSQIERVSKQLAVDSQRLVLATCGPAPGDPAPNGTGELEEGVHLTIGAVRSAGRVQGVVLQTRVPQQPVPGCEPLREFFRDTIEPFLLTGGPSDSPLRQSVRAGAVFRNLRTQVPTHAHDAIDSLEGACTQRRQFDTQARLHFWLHSWLWIHLPLAVSLIVLMFVHIVVALKYW
jgi:hypothetical protein